MTSSSVLDIVICTYNREVELLDCIASLKQQDYATNNWNLMVVNNYHQSLSAGTMMVLSELSNLSIVEESLPGLSYARNRGTKESEAEWIGFLDDDAKVPEDYIRKAMDIIEENHFDCFGGHIRSWWKYGQPRWLDADYGSKPILLKDRGILTEDYNWGSNIFIKKKPLEKVGGFPEDVGLKGSHLGYSAENMIQINLRQYNYKIGYDPDLVIDHVVMPAKLKLWWHVRAAYATGRDGRNIFPEQYGIRGFLISFKNCFSRPLKAILKWMTQKGYYWEHVVLECGKACGLWWGKINSVTL